MFKNYFKTAFRNLRHNKSYAFINIAGLSVGIAACLLVFLVVRYELSFDNFHSKRDRIYRVISMARAPEGMDYQTGVAFPVAGGLRREFPQLEKVAATLSGDELIAVMDNTGAASRKFKETGGVFYAEPALFEMLDFKWLAGNPRTALKDVNTVVLSKSTAEKYFGSWQQAMGKTIKNANYLLLTVTGVLDDVPANSDFPFKVVISYKTFQFNPDDWVSVNSDAYCFVMLPKGLSEERFNTMLAAFAKRHKPAEYAYQSYGLQPFREIHYDERFRNYTEHIFSREMTTAMILIGAFLLIIACVNFINLATAQAVNRSREVGVRKALGGVRWQLALQFLSETFLITVFAVLLSIIWAFIALPFVNQLLEVSLPRAVMARPVILLFLAGLIVVVTLLSGFYPAIVLSGFNPVAALKSRITARMVGGISLRRALVVLQFTVAQVLIIGMLVVVGQMDLFRNAAVGFNKESVITVPVPNDSLYRTRLNYLRNQLAQIPGVRHVSFSFTTPSSPWGWQSDFKFDGATKPVDFAANLKWGDTAFFRTYDLQLVAGRFYTSGDTVSGFVVNEALVKKLGFASPEAILGHKLNFWDGSMVAPVIGVVKDFNSTTLRDPVIPVVMAASSWQYHIANLKIQPQYASAILAAVEKLWKATYPDHIYSYEFVDKKMERFYQQENRLSKMYKLFAGIAIFISCLGLYGLISFMAVQRNKEVGIRKVLGASVRDIVFLLSKEFTLLISIAFVIAAPLAWFIMHRWLESFAYRINIGVSIFLLTIVGSLCIAWITAGFRTLKAALANPVKSLKAE